MRHGWWMVPATALVLLSSGCQDPASQESRWAELRSRLDAIESRIESTEAALQPLDGARRALDDAERRLSGLESRVDRLARQEAGSDATAGAQLPTGSTAEAKPSLQRQNTRRQLRELAAEYRNRLAEIRSEYRHDLANPERRQKMREASQWYRAERRRLLTGEEPAGDATASD